MMKKTRKILLKSIATTLAAVLLATAIELPAKAERVENDPVVIVSLGDSYSAGEGIEPFYGQEKSLGDKVYDEDWLAHRSTLGWPALLKVPGVNGLSGSYRVYKGQTGGDTMQWYFAASSGAVASHIYTNTQKKTVSKRESLFKKYSFDYYLPVQCDIFDSITDDVDYVTMTIGGNDVQFKDIIIDCVAGSSYLHLSSLQSDINELWDEKMDGVKKRIVKSYKAIAEKAGPQATIIVAGYPKLLEQNGKGAAISKEEAQIVNANVVLFDEVLEGLVKQCVLDGMNMAYVDVLDEFDGHEAYSSNAWINKVYLGTKNEDLTDWDISSAYSMHPNATGAQHYAKCVNDKLAALETGKGTITGQVIKAEDRSQSISGAVVSLTRNGENNKTIATDTYGMYKEKLPSGAYVVDVDYPGYVSVKQYIEIESGKNKYLETVMMVYGNASETGTASGKIINALTGGTVADAELTVRRGMNNTEYGDVVATTKSGSNGEYSLNLNLGNYTVNVVKAGFVTSSFNIVVSKGTTKNQDGTITPVLTSGDYRVVLTWGDDPRDLDSHLQGFNSDNPSDSYHVYYLNKIVSLNNSRVCTLDVDDVDGRGPETVTLKTTSSLPYYYYVHKYAGDGSISTSGAKVKLYQGDNEIAVWNAPTDQGTGEYWNVFSIQNGELIISDTITSSPNISY